VGSPLASLLNIIVIGVAFSLPAGVYMLIGNVQSFSGQLSGAPQLSVFLKLGTSKGAIEKLESHLRQHPQIASFRFLSKDKALEQLKQKNWIADAVNSLTRNPLPDAFIIDAKSISPESLNRLRTEMLKWPDSKHVQLDSDWMERLSALLKLGKIGLLILTALLSFALIVVTFNTIRLQILTKRDEIEVSKLIGATSNFIRRPFLYFGAIQGVAGGAIAWLIVALVINLINNELTNLIQLYAVDFQLHHISFEDSISLLLFSSWLGWAGSWLSVANHLWQIEP
jgi:cell division transport system permease protein